jgi:hypothetical protein
VSGARPREVLVDEDASDELLSRGDAELLVEVLDVVLDAVALFEQLGLRIVPGCRPLSRACRAKQVARSGAGGSRPGEKGGVRFDDPNQLFCVCRALEAFADEQPSLVLLVRSDRRVGGWERFV